jgi:glutamate synthase (ferredoxin)
MQMIELSILSADEDMAFVRTLLEEHVKYTGSTKGQKILSSFALHRSRFVKVFPVDYKRALEEAKQAKEKSGSQSHLRVV